MTIKEFIKDIALFIPFLSIVGYGVIVSSEIRAFILIMLAIISLISGLVHLLLKYCQDCQW